MKNGFERRQMILQKVSDVCRRIQVTIICLMGGLIVLDLFDVRVGFGYSHNIKLTAFILITGLFIVSDTIMVYLQTLKEGFTTGRLAWNLFIIWTSNTFVLCCIHNYIFGSSFSSIFPIASSAAWIIGGSQYMFYSLHMRYNRKQNKINNDK